MLIFGTGESVVPPPKEIREYISGLGIQLDVQSSVSRQRNDDTAKRRADCSGTLRRLSICFKRKDGESLLPYAPSSLSSREQASQGHEAAPSCLPYEFTVCIYSLMHMHLLFPCKTWVSVVHCCQPWPTEPNEEGPRRDRRARRTHHVSAHSSRSKTTKTPASSPAQSP